MSFNSVMDTQKIFRILVESSSFPGKVLSIKPYGDSLDYDTICPKPLLALCLALLDGETSFNCSNELWEKDVSLFTNCSSHILESSDFVLLEEEEFTSSNLADVRKGTLIDPHLGATLIWTVKSVLQGDSYYLSGPGIEKEKEVKLDLPSGWLAVRNNMNKEFPLGTDLILLDHQGNLLVLPRSTRVRSS